MDKKKVVVVGAGITGLTVAYRLLKSEGNFEIVVLEGEKIDGFLFYLTISVIILQLLKIWLQKWR